jgi:D-alanine-D-alanine ligase
MGWGMHEQQQILPGEFGKVAVLMGGDSAEREISLMSGQAVLESLLRSGVDAVGVDEIDRKLLKILDKENYDRVFIMLHGRKGEDGKMQGAMELMNLPYTGSGVLASALAMDKVRCKRLWENLELNTPPFTVLDDNTEWQKVVDTLGTVFVKPVKEGSSIGISKVADPEALKKAYLEARQYDNTVIAEKFVDGPEYTVAILGDKVLPVVGMQAENEFYDYEAKYFSDATRYFCPCDLDEESEAELKRLAKQAYDAVDCSGWGRVDVMRDSKGEFWLLEVNTIPGMTSHSLVPMAASEAGINFDALVLEILSSSSENRLRD